MPPAPQPGELAPELDLPDQGGRQVRLADFRGRKVLVFFYLEAGTPDCTVQACGLRDLGPELPGVAVVGVSPDPPDRQATFAERHRLSFPLLSDPDHRAAAAYGAWTGQAMIRSAFLIEESGRIGQVWQPVTPRETAMELALALAD